LDCRGWYGFVELPEKVNFAVLSVPEKNGVAMAYPKQIIELNKDGPN
jgi:hypothetical protein